MQIIIPMTGNGSRFASAGFEIIKPFIKVHGKPMIEWVVKMFPGDEGQITFICRDEHLEKHSYVQKTLNEVAPNAQIFSIKDWVKKGPVFELLNASAVIDDDEPVIVSYCDFYMHWNYDNFKREITNNQCDGAIPCYSGFHPHLIPKNNLYASCKTDSSENLIEIKEKFSWEEDKAKAFHSPGVYYFKSGKILKKYCKALVEAEDSINGEYYASLPFNYLVKDGLTVWCPVNVSHFCQWGTPKDLAEFNFWTTQIFSQGKLDR